MTSQKDVLQVLVCGFQDDTNALTISALPEGELGFFDAAGDIATSGAGRFVMKKNGELIESNWVENFAGWGGLLAYAAPTLREETLQIGAATVGAYYQVQIVMDIKGMTGKYIKEGVYKAVTGDTPTTIAHALATSLQAALTREGNTAIAVTHITDTIHIVQVAQPYVQGKKAGLAVPFTSSITSPEAEIKAGTVVTAGSNGVGTGKYVHAREFFAWGNQDAFRYNGWRNNFEPRCFADPDGQYSVLAVNETHNEVAEGHNVPVSISILIAFDENGAASA